MLVKSAMVVAIGLLGVTGTVQGAFAASEEVPPPSADPFYTPPPHLASFKPGKILRHRKVTISGVSNASAAYQLLYRTTDAKGKPIATVTTLALPSEPAPGPPDLVSIHHAYDSLTLSCAPSYTLRTGQVTGVGDAGISSNIQGLPRLRVGCRDARLRGPRLAVDGRAAGGPYGAGRDPRG